MISIDLHDFTSCVYVVLVPAPVPHRMVPPKAMMVPFNVCACALRNPRSELLATGRRPRRSLQSSRSRLQASAWCVRGTPGRTTCHGSLFNVGVQGL